jgi:hypothetical protein
MPRTTSSREARLATRPAPSARPDSETRPSETPCDDTPARRGMCAIDHGWVKKHFSRREHLPASLGVRLVNSAKSSGPPCFFANSEVVLRVQSAEAGTWILRRFVAPPPSPRRGRQWRSRPLGERPGVPSATSAPPARTASSRQTWSPRLRASRDRNRRASSAGSRRRSAGCRGRSRPSRPSLRGRRGSGARRGRAG